MRTHHPYGPSKLGSIIPGRCQGRVQLEEQVPEIDSGRGAEGTAIHHEIDQCFQAYKKSANVEQLTAKHIKDHEMRFLTSRAIAWFLAKGDPPPPENLETEAQLEIKGADGEVLTFGTADVVIVGKNSVTITDWKTHHDPIDETDALWQTSAYLVGAMQKYGKKKGIGFIYMPRLDLEYRFETTLDEALPLVENAIREAQKPDAPIVPGPWCKYCGAAAICPAMQDTADQIIARVGTPDAGTLPKTKLRERFAGQLKEFAANGQVQKIAELAELVTIIEPAIAAVRDTIRSLIESGHGELFPDWELRERRIRRKANILEIYKRVNTALSPEEFAECADIKWTTLEKIYTQRLETEARDRGDRITKQACKQMLDALLSSVVEYGTTTVLQRRKGE